jgi:hypothetical protein
VPSTRPQPIRPRTALPQSLLARCLYRLTIGEDIWTLPQTGEYQVCVTPKQHRRLFLGRGVPQPIGCGAFACAYPGQKHGQVVKITHDESDVGSLQKAQGLPRIPKIYRTYRLTSPTWRTAPRTPHGNTRPPLGVVHALVMERLKPIPKDEQGAFDIVLDRLKKWGFIQRPTVWHIRKAIDHTCYDADDDQKTACHRLVLDMTRTAKDLRKRGIDFGGDLHAGNIGLDSKGRWKVLDLGFGGGTVRTPRQLGRARRR